MKDYYNRQIMLWGENTQDSLKSKRVAIIGAGGLGCSVALALSGSGIGTIDIIDFDKVEIHNIHRQIAFTTNNLNKPKALVLSELLKSRNPYLKAQEYIEDFNSYAKNSPKLDLIIDATDNLQTRHDIDHFAKKLQIPWIYGAVEEFAAYVCLFQKSDFQAFANHKKGAVGIAAPMVMQVASFEANMALRYLANLSIKSDLLYYLHYDRDGVFQIKSFKV